MSNKNKNKNARRQGNSKKKNKSKENRDILKFLVKYFLVIGAVVSMIIGFAMCLMDSYTSNIAYQYALDKVKDAKSIYYSKINDYLISSDLEKISYDRSTQLILLEMKTGEKYLAPYSCTDEQVEKLLEYDVQVKCESLNTVEVMEEKIQATKNITFLEVLDAAFGPFQLFFTFYVLIIFLYFYSKMLVNPLGGKNNEFEPVEAEDIASCKVAGLDSIVSDMEDIINIYKNRDKLSDLGIECPKGVLFAGPPGVGKTLIAKHIAKMIDLPFISCSGSDFTEVYVGLGARRVKELFKSAREMEKGCVIFIDEVDTLACRRDGNTGNTEDKRTLNALLKEMDGVLPSAGILIIAATNFEDQLDPAFTRPKRFNRTIKILPPSTKADRDAIIDVHLTGKKIGESFDKEYLSKITRGMTGAAIGNILDNAVVESIIKGREGVIEKDDVDTALDKFLLKGNVQESTNVESDKRVAIHEAGHALLGLLAGKEVLKVTNIGTTSGFGGFTLSVPAVEMDLKTKRELEVEVMELYGGIVAETLILGEPSIGASNDIERATEAVKSLVGTYGLSGTYLNLNNLDQKVFTEMCMKEAGRLKVETEKIMDANQDFLMIIANDVMTDKTIYNLNEKYEDYLKLIEKEVL